MGSSARKVRVHLFQERLNGRLSNESVFQGGR